MKVGYSRYTKIKFDCLDQKISLSIACMGASVPVVVNYQMYDCIVIYAVVAVVWIVLGMFYYRQRSREKYRDDVEAEIMPVDGGEIKPRKVRIHFVDGLTVIALFLFLTALFLTITYFLLGVIFRVRLAGVNDY